MHVRNTDLLGEKEEISQRTQVHTTNESQSAGKKAKTGHLISRTINCQVRVLKEKYRYVPGSFSVKREGKNLKTLGTEGHAAEAGGRKGWEGEE